MYAQIWMVPPSARPDLCLPSLVKIYKPQRVSSLLLCSSLAAVEGGSSIGSKHTRRGPLAAAFPGCRHGSHITLVCGCTLTDEQGRLVAHHCVGLNHEDTHAISAQSSGGLH
jgi:hypothetical protein